MTRLCTLVPLTVICALCTTEAKEAIILGSSGLVGSLVLQRMLDSPEWTTIHLVVRKAGDVSHDKLNQMVVRDLRTMAVDPQLLKLATGSRVDAAVVTLGVNEPFGWTVQQLMDVEVDLTSLFAGFCRTQLGVTHISVLTMAGAERGNPFSSEELAQEITYWSIFALAPRVKGAVEEAVLDAKIPSTTFFQPAQFETDEYRFGFLDVFMQYACSALNFVVPSEYHSIHVSDLARAMFEATQAATDEVAAADGPVAREVVMLYDDMIRLAASPNTEL